MKNFNELVTIVIPIFNLVIDRYLNFKFILKKLNGLQIPIIVVEQKSDKTNQTVAQKLLVNYPDILYKEVLINDNKIHKSKLVNIGNSLLTTKYLWMLDSDCYMKYMNVANRIINQPVIHPFNKGIYLTKHESDKFLSSDKLILTEQKRDHVVTDFGPLTFIIRRDIFNKIGGMNEEYTGYGWEDYEFANKLYEYPLEQFPITALHLYHTPCKN
jgi:predicted glycosyltransferase involved in capsule biosynthesis